MAYGDISSQVDTEELDSSEGHDINGVKLSNGYIALWYQGAGWDGFIKTYPVDGSGNIGSLIDSWEFNTVSYYLGEHGACQVYSLGNNVYIFFYQYVDALSSQYLYAQSVNIDATGTITKSFIDSVATFMAGSGTPSRYPTGMAKKSGSNTFAVVLGSSTTAYLYTFTVDADGDNITNVDSWAFATVSNPLPRVVFMGGDVFAVTYASGTNTILATIEVADDGTITKSFLDSATITSRTASYPAPVTSSVCSIFFAGGYVSTYSVDGSGNLTSIDSSQYKTGVTFNLPRASYLGVDGTDCYFGIVYTRGASDAYLITLDIDTSGNIGSLIDEQGVESANVSYAYPMVKANIDVFIVPWNYGGNQGNFDSFVISVPLAPGEARPITTAYIID